MRIRDWLRAWLLRWLDSIEQADADRRRERAQRRFAEDLRRRCIWFPGDM